MTSIAITGARVALSAAMLACAWQIWHELHTGYVGAPSDTAAGSALAALAAFTSAWLLVGVRSRAVALMSLVVHTGAGQWLAMHGLEGPTWLMAVPLLCVPVLIFGGGALALSRGGWRGVI